MATGNIPQSIEKENMPYRAAIAQLQAEVAGISDTVADVRQIVALWPAAFAGVEDQVKHVIDQNDRIVALIADPNDPDAGVAALAGISRLLELVESHTVWLRQIEAALASTADRMDVLTHELAAHDAHVERRIVKVAEGQARDIHTIARRQLVLVGAMTALAVLMLIHSYEVAARLDAAFVSTFMFLLGLIARGR